MARTNKNINYAKKNYLKTIGSKIKYFRKLRGLKQQDLANALGVAWETVSRWENGNVSPLRRLNQIAKVLEIPLTYLISDVIPQDLAQQTPTQSGIPYIGRLPKTHEELEYATHKTLFNLDLAQLARDYHLAVQVDTDSLINYTNIPIDNNTILIIKPSSTAQNYKYALFYDESKGKFVLKENKKEETQLPLVATVALVMLQ